MGIPTLIKTLTADGDTSLSFVDGASSVVFDSTYDEYMFVFTDIGPATDDADLTFQVNATDDAGGGYDTSLITSTTFEAYHFENDDPDTMGYNTGESCAGILHIFSPASTTYVKHFYSRFNMYGDRDLTLDLFAAGYINDTTAIDEIQFKMSSGNFDGVIQMYGIS
mgnify:CR=1 FL=1